MSNQNSSEQNQNGDQPKPKRFMDQLKEAIRLKKFSYRTEDAYCYWVKKFIFFHDTRHPKDMGKEEVEAFLKHLAVDLHVSASTQNQALNALVFMYKELLKAPVGELKGVPRAKKPTLVPEVMTTTEVRKVLDGLYGVPKLFCELLYGSGIRLTEGLRLRVKDIDFEKKQITVHQGKGMKDRITMLPEKIIPELRAHLKGVKQTHERDLSFGFGAVQLPFALNKKYPSASKEFRWQFVFPASRISKDPRSDFRGRYHLHETVIQKAVRMVVNRIGLSWGTKMCPLQWFIPMS